jgi:hypothetical protein
MGGVRMRSATAVRCATMDSMKHPPISRALLAVVASLGIAGAAQAHDYTLGPLAIGHPHARPTAPGQPTGGGYLTVTNRGTAPDRLVGASAPSVAQAVEVHEMRLEGNVMRMREIGTLELPPGKTVKLEPGGLHLMIMGLKGPLAAGQHVPLTLTFEKAGRIEVDMTVDAASSAAPASATMDHGTMRH